MWAWFENEKGETVSEIAGSDSSVVVPGATSDALSISVHQPLPAEQRLMLRWRDQDGEHTKDTSIRPRLHA